MRSGAVVRCEACDSKYRIKSAHFVREIHTGPRTLGETDTVLRSDSVDIDPDEVSPVSIDDDGNVVGLSGLSELMRWSDTQDSSQVTGVPKPGKPKRKPKPAAQEALPAAKPAKPKTKAPAASTKSKPGDGRARAQAIKRKKRNNTLISIGAAVAAVVVIALIVPMLIPNNTIPNEAPSDDGTPGTELAGSDTQTPGNGPETDGTSPDTEKPDEVLVFSEDYKPSPNPQIKFVPPWTDPDNSLPPTDVPTVLTPVVHLTHEDWYVMNPPRGSADATGASNVELGQIVATPLDERTTLLAGSVANNTTRVVKNGELHIMLLDSTGNVFAETYTPVAMIEPNNAQPITLTIPTRYWKRSRGVRAGVQVQAWADTIEPLQGIRLEPTGQGKSSTLRVSVKHEGERPLRSVTMLLSATDTNGHAIANFFIEESNLYIRKDQWLDLVAATPLPKGREAAGWAVTVVPQ